MYQVLVFYRVLLRGATQKLNVLVSYNIKTRNMFTTANLLLPDWVICACITFYNKKSDRRVSLHTRMRKFLCINQKEELLFFITKNRQSPDKTSSPQTNTETTCEARFERASRNFQVRNCRKKGIDSLRESFNFPLFFCVKQMNCQVSYVKTYGLRGSS